MLITSNYIFSPIENEIPVNFRPQIKPETEQSEFKLFFADLLPQQVPKIQVETDKLTEQENTGQNLERQGK
jgi:hypothetical protein